MTTNKTTTTTESIIALIIILALVALSAMFGARYAPGQWYESLTKPWWTPPKGIFAPVWTLLYLSIAVSAWLVWRRVGWRLDAAIVFLLQLALNAVWSYLFFGLHRMDYAFYDIIALWIAVLLMMLVFWRLRTAAGAMLIPYWLWVGFAALLNFTLWRANGAS